MSKWYHQKPCRYCYCFLSTNAKLWLLLLRLLILYIKNILNNKRIFKIKAWCKSFKQKMTTLLLFIIHTKKYNSYLLPYRFVVNKEGKVRSWHRVWADALRFKFHTGLVSAFNACQSRVWIGQICGQAITLGTYSNLVRKETWIPAPKLLNIVNVILLLFDSNWMNES